MATLAEVRQRSAQRADMEYDPAVSTVDRFVTNTELDSLINLGYAELYGALARQGMHRVESVESITATGAATYSLPADLWAVLTVHRVDNTGEPAMLRRHDHRLRTSSTFAAPGSSYRVVGTSIEFNPRPASGTYEVRYVPVPGTLTADDQTLDGVLGWEEYVVLFVAARLLQKEGSHSDADKLKMDARELMQRIQDEAQAAEMSEGSCIQNVTTGAGDVLPGGFVGWYRSGWLL